MIKFINKCFQHHVDSPYFQSMHEVLSHLFSFSEGREERIKALEAAKQDKVISADLISPGRDSNIKKDGDARREF